MLRTLEDAVALAPVKPAIQAGLRAATAIAVPLVLSVVLQRPELSFTSLAAFLGAVADKGGAYRSRSLVLGAFLAGAVVLAPLAGLFGSVPPLGVASVLVVGSLLAFARIYGGNAGSVGAVLLVLFLVSLAQPITDLGEAIARAGWVALGAAWTMALSLFMWPVRLYRPARAAVAKVLRALAAFARGPAPEIDDRLVWLRLRRGEVRKAIEDARAVLAATRRGRRGDSGRGMRLLALLETADRLFASLVVVAEHAPDDLITLVPLADPLDAAARAVEEESDAPAPPPALAPAPSSTPHERLLARPRALTDEVLSLASSIEDERVVPELADPDEREPRPIVGPILANMNARSSLLRHALRVGVATTIGAVLAALLEVQRPHWVTVSVAVVLQPQLPATFVYVTQRVLGTVLGALIAAALTFVVDTPAAMLPVFFVLAAIGVAVQPLNYALYSAFLTPAFVLLAESATHDPSLVTARIVNALAGGALALVAARVLWPIAERDLFTTTARDMLQVTREHFATLLATDDEDRRTQARRAVGRELLNAETSVNRWLAEIRQRSPAALEAPLAMVAFTRHLNGAFLVLAELTTLAERHACGPFNAALDAALVELEAAIAEGRVAPAPNLEALVAENEPLHTAMLRIAEHLAVLHAATGRWLGGHGVGVEKPV